MATAMDQMERLINEADAKFEEKFRSVVSGMPSNLNAYTDRTYSLRQQVAHNAQLAADERFMSMLSETERCLAPDFAVRGEPDKRLAVVAAGLLKTLLRETVALPSYAARKVQLEMAWQWNQEKQRQILDYALSKIHGGPGDGGGGSDGASPPPSAADALGPRRASAAAAATASVSAVAAEGGGGSGAGAAAAPSSPPIGGKFGERLRVAVYGGDGGGGGACRPLGFTDDAGREEGRHAIAKKLGLYRRRNLAKAEASLRCDPSAANAGSANANSGGGGGVRVVLTADAQRRAAAAAGGSAAAAVAALASNGGGVRGGGAVVFGGVAGGGFGGWAGPAGPPAYVHVAGARAAEFAPPRTAATSAGAGAGAGAVRPQTQPAARAAGQPAPAGSAFGGSGGSGGSAFSTASLDAALAQAHQRWTRHTAAAAERAADARALSDARSLFSHAQARIEEETARRLESDTYASQTGRTCHTILRRVPRPSSSSSSAAATNANPQSAANAGAASDGGAACAVTARSLAPSASLPPEEAIRLLGRQVYHGTDVSLSPYDAFAPTAMDEKRLQALLARVRTADDAQAAARARHGLSAPDPRAGAASSHCNAALDCAVVAGATAGPKPLPRTGVPLLEQLVPALAPEADVPSLQRLAQLRLVDRIRECFARSAGAGNVSAGGGKKGDGGGGMHVPRAVIERAMLTPDDRPYEECIRLLPRPGSFFPSNPWAQRDKANPKRAAGGAGAKKK